MFFGTMIFPGDPNTSTVYDLVNLNQTQFSLWDRYMLAVYFPSSPYFRPFQIVTYMFMHGNFTHLLMNMFGLVFLGPYLERAWGPQKFLFYYLFTAIGALLAQWGVQYIEVNFAGASPFSLNVPMLGASGAVFGILAAIGMQWPNAILQFIFPPISMKAKYFVLLYAAIELFLGVGNFQTGVAHFAHLGGAAFGVLLILYWRKKGERLY
ncbi:MAG TPA: rhomboid family intramembrane serine protease [Bacteroidetes bacterium]|nr:rhomboid family intramembrane serine protease [Bacteroidota bacterium]